MSFQSTPLSETRTGEEALVSYDGGLLQMILLLWINLALTTLSPILQNGNTPYSGFCWNQAPVIVRAVPPDVRPLAGSTFVTTGSL